MTASTRTAAHLVIGGGLAGSLLGMRLAQAGREVTILERERTAHHKVCGEFLSREAVDYLRAAGVDPVSLGAQPIHFVRLSARRLVAQSALPFTALSLSRCVLDEALLRRAELAGCDVQRGASVEGLTPCDGEWQAQLRSGEIWRSSCVFLASGKHDVRGLERKPGSHGDLVGFKMHWRLAGTQTEALRGWMDLFLFTGGYGGLSLVEGDTTNFCFVVRRSTLRRAGGWAELFNAIRQENPHVAERLEGATAMWEKPLAVSSIPYGYLAGSPQELWCVGDQAAVIPSFTGDGMSIALHSAALAAEMTLAGQSAGQYHQELCRHLNSSMKLATALSRTMVNPMGRIFAPMVLSIVPRAMNWIARMTRVPDRALRQTGPARGT